jgi:hypothetical protein
MQEIHTEVVAATLEAWSGIRRSIIANSTLYENGHSASIRGFDECVRIVHQLLQPS